MKHLKSDLSLGERYHKMIAYMITKQGGLARAIYFWKKRASTPLGMFYQERDTEVKSNPSALFGIIAVFDFGLCIWQSIWRLWRRSSEDQQK